MTASPPQADGAARLVRSLNRGVDVSIEVPGSKSLSNRALLLAGLARGRSHLRGVLRSDDTDALIEALRTFGARIDVEDDVLHVTGIEQFQPDRGTIDLGAGGTPARFMLAVAALTQAPIVLDGTPRLRERPMADLLDMLTQLGASLEPLGRPGHLPIRAHAAAVRGGSLRINTQASSQFVSALLLIGPRLEGGIELTFDVPPTSETYIRLTLSELKAWGVQLSVIHDQEGHLSRIRIEPGDLAPRDRTIPADASSALYWAMLATICSQVRITIPGLDPSDGQPDHHAIAALQAVGLGLQRTPAGVVCSRIHDDVPVAGFGDLDASRMPDGAVALAVVAACGDTQSRIGGLHTLRIKECDRVQALHLELTRVGANVTIEGDDLVFRPADSDRATISEVEIRTYDDHRIAMAFAILGLRRGGITIEDPACVSKSYPGFWNDLSRLEPAAPSRDTATSP